MPSTHNYTFDASVLITIALERYPKDIFPSFWAKLESFINDGHLKVIKYVWDEVQWNSGVNFKAFEGRICVNMSDLTEEEQDQIQDIVASILQETPSILKTKRNQIQSWWDPWIIAHAMLHNLTVVTNEKSDPVNKNKMPDICRSMWIRCITLLDFLREIGWSI